MSDLKYLTASAIIAQFLGKQNVVAVPIILVRLTGDFTSAAFLAQAVYWQQRTTSPDGFFWKTHDDWAEELCLSAKQVRRCVDACDGIVEVDLRGIPARNHYRVDMARFVSALERLVDPNDKMCPKVTTGQPEGAPTHPKGAASYAQRSQLVHDQRSQLVTENTPETTGRDYKHTLSPDGDLRVTAAPHQVEHPDAPDQKPVKPRGKGSRKNSAASSEDVARAAPFFDAWAQIAAPALGTLRAVSDKRVKAVVELIDALGADALTLFTDAATFVATHPKTRDFWKAGGYGFDNLINERGAKVVKYAEAYAAQKPAPDAPQTPRRKYEDD